MRRIVVALCITLVAACSDAATTSTAVTPTATPTTVAPTTPSSVPPTVSVTAGATSTTTLPAPQPTTTIPVPPPTSTIPVPPTTSTIPATSTVPPTPLFVVDESAFFPAPLAGSADAHGSGCVADTAAPLPDGIWFGFVEAFTPPTITFDLACLWTGAAAEAAATADGAEVFDSYIRNMNPATFAVAVAPTARAWYLDPPTLAQTEVGALDWPTPASFLTCPGEYCSVWLYVNAGRATGIVEQYLP